MPKADLDRCWSFRGRPFGPGTNVEVPQELYDILKKAGRIEEASPETSEEAPHALFGGLTNDQVRNLEAAGYDSVAAIQAASIEDLKTVDEIGPATVKKLKERAG